MTPVGEEQTFRGAQWCQGEQVHGGGPGGSEVSRLWGVRPQKDSPTEREEEGAPELSLLPSPAGTPALWLLLPCPHLPGDQDGAEAAAWGACGHANRSRKLLGCKTLRELCGLGKE